MTAKSLLHAELDLSPTSSNVIISTQIHCVKMCLCREMDRATLSFPLSQFDKLFLIHTSAQGIIQERLLTRHRDLQMKIFKRNVNRQQEVSFYNPLSISCFQIWTKQLQFWSYRIHTPKKETELEISASFSDSKSIVVFIQDISIFFHQR